jgi:hypothetical protein
VSRRSRARSSSPTGEPITEETLIRAPELGLRFLAAAVLTLAAALLVLRLA